MAVRAHTRLYLIRDPEKVVPASVWRRIEAKFIPEPNSGCWLWLGATKEDYAKLKLESYASPIYVHRYLFEKCTGRSLPRDVLACHFCDVRPCINPWHVFAGTQRDNVTDCIRKRRHAFGERSAMAKLTIVQIQEMAASSQSNADLARRFGVEERYVWRVKTGRTWKLALEMVNAQT